jgi:hypothetical protein
VYSCPGSCVAQQQRIDRLPVCTAAGLLMGTISNGSKWYDNHSQSCCLVNPGHVQCRDTSAPQQCMW